MKWTHRCTLLVAVSALPLFAVGAEAHEFWLSPSRYHAAAGDTLTLDARVGTGFRGEASPYATTRTRRLLLRGAGEQDLRHSAINGALQWARWIAADGGGALVAFESDFKPIELAPALFDAYLKLEGLDQPLAFRVRLGKQAPAGRERFARCPKVWIAGTDANRATRAVGFPLELVPLEAPGARSVLPVKLLWHGRPLAGALLRAWVQPLATGRAPRDFAQRDSVNAVFAARTAQDGTVRVPVRTAGEWMFSAVHMVPSAEPDKADWDSYWASLAFAR